VTTNTASVTLTNAWVDAISRLNLNPLHPDPSIKISTGMGDVFLYNSIPTGLRVSTRGGNIYSTGTASGALGLKKACGDIELSATGYGRVVVAQAFVAYESRLTSEHGEIVVANSGTLIGTDLTIKSNDGNIFISSMLQVRERGREGSVLCTTNYTTLPLFEVAK
jgi:hypothetical protein